MPTDTSSTPPRASDPSSSNGSPNRLGDAAGDVLDQAGRTAERQASSAMTRAGDTLDQVARAVRDSGGQIRAERPEIANIADSAAQRVEDVAAYLREHDAREILDQADRLARRQPALVIGGGLLLGLIAGRLLRSGAEPTNGSSSYWSGAGSYRGAAGWSGGSTSDLSSSRPNGSTMPGSGYGTGYGASYDTTVDSVPETAAENLAATDAAAVGRTSSGSAKTSGSSSSSSKRGSRSTGES